MNIMTIVDPRDYQGLSTLLTFTPSNDMRTVNVVLFDDTIVEGSEFFNGNINGSNLVNASPNRATVIVNENITTDSELLTIQVWKLLMYLLMCMNIMASKSAFITIENILLFE